MPDTVKLQDGTELDGKVVKVMKAIRQIESGGDYNAVGDLDKGVSRGAYQFNKNNFKTWAVEHKLDPNDFSPANQNKVAYARIKKFKDEGKQPEEIAALWNGAKKTPDGKYTYINPEYGVKFRNALQQNSSPAQSTGLGGSYPTPPEVKPFTPSVSPETPEKKGIVQKGLEFLFPILEKKQRTGLQTAADLGLSALTLVPGLGAGGLGVKAANVGVKGALKGLIPAAVKGSTLLKGAGAGYGIDVLSNLSKGETGSETFTPGLGTALGGAGAVALRGLKGTSIGKKAIEEDAFRKASEIVAPVLNKKNVKSSLKQGLGEKSGLVSRNITVGQDARSKRAAESITDLIKRGAIKTTDTVEKKSNVILDEIGIVADDLENKLLSMDVQPILSPTELKGLISKTEKVFEESPILVGDAGLAAKKIFNKFVSFLPKGKDVTAYDLLQARKNLDRWIKAEGRGSAFNPNIENAISKGLREIRQGANELIAEKAPDVAVKDMLRKQSAMYDALEAVIENSWKEVGTSAIGRYLGRHPIQKGVIQGAIGATVPAFAGGYVASKLND